MARLAAKSLPEDDVTRHIDPARDIAHLVPYERAQRRAWLHDVRWRTGRRGRVWMTLVIAAILLLHLALMLAVRQQMRPRDSDLRPPDSVIHVNLIELPPPAELPPVPIQMPTLIVTGAQAGTANNSPAPPRPAPAARPVAPAAPSTEGVEGIVATPTAPHLYNPDGSLHLSLPTQTAPTQQPLQAGIAAGKEMLRRGHNVVRCKRSRFANAYAPDESVGDKVARKYGSLVGMYNPHSADKLAERQADAAAACDDDGL